LVYGWQELFRPGAYTAGVMDYLIEVLNEWEKHRFMDPNVPQHEVCIPIMGGASAGGMTALLTASTIYNTNEPGGLHILCRYERFR